MENKFDLGIIGGGPAGYSAAIRACQKGLKTVLFEKDCIGGVCLNRGCIPTKTILHCTDFYKNLKKAEKFGITISDKAYDYDKIFNRKNDVVLKIQKSLTKLRDILFPQNITCDLCGAEIFDGGHLCAKCAKTVVLNDKTVCPVCGRKTARAEICYECKAFAPRYKKGVSVFVYKDGGAKLIIKFKSGARYLKDYLGNIMAQKAKKLPACDAVTYVPITKKRKRERG